MGRRESGREGEKGMRRGDRQRGEGAPQLYWNCVWGEYVRSGPGLSALRAVPGTHGDDS